MSCVCLVNLAQLDPPANGGTSRIAYEVGKMLASWSRSSSELTVFFVVNWRFAAHFGEWLGEDVFTLPYFSPLDLRRLSRVVQPDLIVSPLFGMTPFGGGGFSNAHHIAEMPDALVLDRPERFTPRQFRRRVDTYRQLSNASVVATLSNHARARLQHHLNLPEERFRVIPLGAEALDSASPAELPIALPERYVFYPSNVWPHKRHALLLEVMARISAYQPDVHLVLAGGRDPRSSAQIQDLIRQSQYPADHVIDLGYVTDSQLRLLYERAEALLFVSEYEGFGMPLVEAMHYGCPVICAPVTAIPEVVGEAALYVDSDDPNDWANAFLVRLPQNKGELVEKGRQRARHFTWEQMRDQWRTLIEETGLYGARSEDVRPPVIGSLVEPDLLARLKTLTSEFEGKQSRTQEFLYLMRHYCEVRTIRAASYTALSDYLKKSK